MIVEPPATPIEEAQVDEVKPRRQRKKAPERMHRTIIKHIGLNRHQKRSIAKTSRTKQTRYVRHQLKEEMNRKRRDRRNQSFKRNIGNQFRGAV